MTYTTSPQRQKAAPQDENAYIAMLPPREWENMLRLDVERNNPAHAERVLAQNIPSHVLTGVARKAILGTIAGGLKPANGESRPECLALIVQHKNFPTSAIEAMLKLAVGRDDPFSTLVLAHHANPTAVSAAAEAYIQRPGGLRAAAVLVDSGLPPALEENVLVKMREQFLQATKRDDLWGMIMSSREKLKRPGDIFTRFLRPKAHFLSETRAFQSANAALHVAEKAKPSATKSHQPNTFSVPNAALVRHADAALAAGNDVARIEGLYRLCRGESVAKALANDPQDRPPLPVGRAAGRVLNPST